MIQRVCLIILLCGMVQVQAQAQAQSLDAYLIMAVDSNAALRSSYLQYEAALEQVPQAGKWPDPEISIGYFISPVETRVGAQQARFTAMQMFPWFGIQGARRDSKTEMALARYAAYAQDRNDLVYEVKKTYYTLYELDQAIRITDDNLAIMRSFESLATTRFENGSGGMADVLRIRMEIAELENQVLFQRDKRTPLLATFNRYLNREAEADVAIPDTMPVTRALLDRTVLSDSAQALNNKIAGLRHMAEAARHSVVVARKQGAPAIGAGMNYIMVDERTDMAVPDNGRDAFMPVLSMKIPVYRGSYKARVREAGLEVEALQQMENDQRNKLRVDMEMAWAAYLDADRRLSLYREQMKVATQAMHILLESYSAEGRDFEEVLRMQRLILKYELEKERAVKDYNTAVAKIESLI